MLFRSLFLLLVWPILLIARNIWTFKCDNCHRYFTGIDARDDDSNFRGSDAVSAHKRASSHLLRSERCKGSRVSKVLLTFGASDARVGGTGTAQQPKLGAARSLEGDLTLMYYCNSFSFIPLRSLKRYVFFETFYSDPLLNRLFDSYYTLIRRYVFYSTVRGSFITLVTKCVITLLFEGFIVE